MFQTFEAPAQRGAATTRIKELRRLMAAARLDAFLVPRADEHQGEYVPPSAERLKWLTGFSGSAGLAIVGKTAAALFVDGRYTVQARAEVDAATFEVCKFRADELDEWLGAHLRRGQPSASIPSCTRRRCRAAQAGATAEGHQARPVRAIPSTACGGASGRRRRRSPVSRMR